ncbi:MAG: RNA polymerase sigma factor [Acutalibacteraceae bacterium]
MQNEFKELVLKSKKGDTAAFAQLYSAVYKDLYKYAYFTLRTRQDAEDAVSDTVTDCFATIGKLRDENSFKNWMFKVLSAKCKRRLTQYYNIPSDIDALAETESETSDFDTSIDLKNAFMSLNEDDRMIISLTVFGNYDSAEVAKILDMNRNTVRSRYSRALAKLREALEPANT